MPIYIFFRGARLMAGGRVTIHGLLPTIHVKWKGLCKRME